MVLVEAGDCEAECRGEVFFVAEHDVHQGRETAVHLLGFRFSANRLPQRRTVVQVVGDDSSGSLGGFHGFLGHKRRGFRQSAEDAAAVKPAGPVFGENLIPVDLAGLQLRDGGVPPVGASERRANAEAALGEIQAVADGAADAVIRGPADIFLADAALPHEVFDEAADGIVRERGDDRSIQAEAALETAGYVVFAAALPGAEMAR